MAAINPASLTNRFPADTNGLADILPLKPPVEIPSGWAWLWWLVGALAIVAGVAALIWYLGKRARLRPPPPIAIEPPHLRAKRRIEAALRFLSDPKLFCSEVSDALRWYLEERFRLRAPERTTEEFLNDLQRTTHLSDAQKQTLASFLEECDLVKFARFEPHEEALRRLRETALRLVDETAYDLATTVAQTPSAKPPPLPAGMAKKSGSTIAVDNSARPASRLEARPSEKSASPGQAGEAP